MADTTEARLRAMLNPRSIAIVGASADPTKAGGRPLRYLRMLGYDGSIYPVNPSRTEIDGMPCYPSLAEVPGPVDLCVLAVSAEAAEPSLRACAAAGISSVIIFASGFAEVGDDGRRRQDGLRRIAAEHDIAIMGPNCLGFVNFGTGAAATFTTALERRAQPLGRIAFVTQSGAVGAFVLGLAADQNVGLSYFVTTGNEAVLGFADYAGALLDDPDTTVIAGYVEGLDGTRLIDLARRALDADKPLVLMKVGASAAGAAASAAHTGKLVGSDHVYSAVFERFGITRAESVEQLLDFSTALAAGRRPAGRRIGVVSISGGAAILMADWCERLGLEMARFGEATSARLREALPWFGSTGNPVDTTGRPLWDEGMLGEALAAVAADPGVDVVLCHVGLAPGSEVRVAAEIGQAARGTGKPMLVTWLPENDPAPQQGLRDAGVPIFVDPVRMTRAAAVLVEQAEASRRARPAAPPPVPVSPPDGALVTEQAATAWLREQGLSVPHGIVARTAEEAVEAARRIGYPGLRQTALSGRAAPQRRRRGTARARRRPGRRGGVRRGQRRGARRKGRRRTHRRTAARRPGADRQRLPRPGLRTVRAVRHRRRPRRGARRHGRTPGTGGRGRSTRDAPRPARRGTAVRPTRRRAGRRRRRGRRHRPDVRIDHRLPARRHGDRDQPTRRLPVRRGVTGRADHPLGGQVRPCTRSERLGVSSGFAVFF